MNEREQKIWAGYEVACAMQTELKAFVSGVLHFPSFVDQKIQNFN